MVILFLYGLITLSNRHIWGGGKRDLFFFLFRIYERSIQTPSMAIPAGTTVWLGQRNNIHGFFKVWIVLTSALYDIH